MSRRIRDGDAQLKQTKCASN